jgi:hypothetical protein
METSKEPQPPWSSVERLFKIEIYVACDNVESITSALLNCFAELDQIERDFYSNTLSRPIKKSEIPIARQLLEPMEGAAFDE